MSLTLGVEDKLHSAIDQAPEARLQLSPEPVLKYELKEWSKAEPWENESKKQMSPLRGGTLVLSNS